MHPWRWLLLLIAACVLLGAVLELVPPLLIRRILDEYLTKGRQEGLVLLALLYLGATASVQGIGFFSSYLTAVAAQGALHQLRVRLFAHLQRLPLSYYDQTPLGEIISRCTADVEAVDTLFLSGVASVVADSVRLLTTSVAMIALSPLLSLVSALVVPPLLLVTRFFQVNVRDAERANRRAIGLLNAYLQETLGGVEIIRAFGREAFFIARFRKALAQALAAFNRATAYSALYSPLMALLAALAISLLLWVGTRQAFASWGISLGSLTAFVLLFQRFFKPITALGDEWQTVQSALSGAERIFQVLSLPGEAPSHTKAIMPRRQAECEGQVRPAIELQDVTFGYLSERPVLREVNLAVYPGEHVALVGQTGAGKSSICNLLSGLYAPWSGRVSIASIDPRNLAEDERRRIVGVVPQAVQLFSGTVLENLTLGDKGVSAEAVQQAAAIAGADDFIRALPQGYSALLSNGRGEGVQLSAGQRQLLALARALVWDPQVLLLDEATSAVDSASEATFRAALQANLRDHRRAVLTIAHRLATAREADRVLVLENGRVIEEGSPSELVRRGGRFAALLELEAAGWEI